MTARRARHRSIALACLAVLAAACTGTEGAVKSGGPAPPVVLVLANNDTQGLIGVPAVKKFVNKVDELSDGHLTVRVNSAWEGGNDEANVVRDVAAGGADLGWAGSRVFDRFGVDSLRPLSAPYLVDSYPLEVEVIRRGQARLLSDVGVAGVSPLALDADELRFPAAVSRPLVTVDDWSGLSVRTLPSFEQEAAIAALGASPVSGGDFVNGIESGAVDAIEVMWEGFLSNNIIDLAPYVTPNAPLWPRAVVLFANPDSLDALTSEQRRWITRAADASSAWAATHVGEHDADLMVKACRAGARIGAASPQDRQALLAAATPVYDQLRNDPALASTLAWIERLKSSGPSPVVVATPRGCAYRPHGARRSSIAPLKAPGETGALPVGTYRLTLTKAHLTSAGIPARDVDTNAGVFTWTLGDGVFSVVQQPTDPAVQVYPCSGYLRVTGHVAQFTRTVNQPYGDCIPPNWTATWALDGGRLVWSDLQGFPEVYDDFAPFFVGIPWQQIR